MAENRIEAIPTISFADAGILERFDLQRLLRDQIELIAPDTLVISEEFGEFEGINRSIDLLAINSDGNLVVIELKRTESGGHMDLQAVRYAAMVSTMTFDQAVSCFERYVQRRGQQRNARQELLDFLGWDDDHEHVFADIVKIILASADFSQEVTSTVLWLNAQGLDIRCVRIKPYGSRDNLLLDVQQVIPLPEAQDYQVRLKEKQQKERESRQSSRDVARFDVHIYGEVHQNLPKRRAVFEVIQAICSTGISPVEVSRVLSWRKKLFFSVDGEVNSETFETLARQQSPPIDPIRWFYEDSELMHADGKTYALTNQWGPRGENAMQEVIDHFRVSGVSFERKS